MRGGWLSPRGAHRAGGCASLTVAVIPSARDVTASGLPSLPPRTPGASRPPADRWVPPALDLQDLGRVRDGLAAMTRKVPPSLPEDKLPVPSFIYPPPSRDPGPREYARLMRRVSALTGTTSSYGDPAAWPGRQLTATPIGGEL